MSHLFDRQMSHSTGPKRPSPPIRPYSRAAGERTGNLRYAGVETDEEKAQRLAAEEAKRQEAIKNLPPKDCTYGRRLPTFQIVAAFMYFLIALIGIVLVIAYWNNWWNNNRIYALLAILGIVIFAVLGVVTVLIAPCAPPGSDKQY